MPRAVIALGSNIAPAKEHIDRAIKALSAAGTVKEVAPYIISKPEGYSHQEDFINTVLILSTPFQPMPLLKTKIAGKGVGQKTLVYQRPARN